MRGETERLRLTIICACMSVADEAPRVITVARVTCQESEQKDGDERLQPTRHGHSNVGADIRV